MENKIRQSILKTVLYADIFDYPLSSAQLWKFLISERKISKKTFDKVLKNISFPITSKSGIYFIKGKEKNVDIKIKRKIESSKKISLAYGVCEIISYIPFVLFLGISGGLSMENSDKKDDIDLFVVTSKNRVWTARLFIIIVLKLLNKHRGRKDKSVRNKICLNMLIDESHLSFSKEKNIYMAHEIAQLIPVFDRKNIYKKIIAKNLWVNNFLPNVFIDIGKKNYLKSKKLIFVVVFDVLEFIVKYFQLWYIRRHITIEKVEDGFLSFHPFNYSDYIISSYGDKLKKYGQKI